MPLQLGKATPHYPSISVILRQPVHPTSRYLSVVKYLFEPFKLDSNLSSQSSFQPHAVCNSAKTATMEASGKD